MNMSRDKDFGNPASEDVLLYGFMYKVSELISKHKLTGPQARHLINAAQTKLNTILPTNPESMSEAKQQY